MLSTDEYVLIGVMTVPTLILIGGCIMNILMIFTIEDRELEALIAQP